MSDMGEIAAWIGGIVAVLSLLATSADVHMTRLNNQAQLWLELRKMFGEHNHIHLKLRPGGEWATSGPRNDAEWQMVESYMGLFEHCQVLMEKRLIDKDTFRKIYRYRLINIVSNDIIREEKLVKRAEGWMIFLELCHSMDLQSLKTPEE